MYHDNIDQLNICWLSSLQKINVEIWERVIYGKCYTDTKCYTENATSWQTLQYCWLTRGNKKNVFNENVNALRFQRFWLSCILSQTQSLSLILIWARVHLYLRYQKYGLHSEHVMPTLVQTKATFDSIPYRKTPDFYMFGFFSRESCNTHWDDCNWWRFLSNLYPGNDVVCVCQCDWNFKSIPRRKIALWMCIFDYIMSNNRNNRNNIQQINHIRKSNCMI